VATYNFKASPRVFISSTGYDLEDYREAAIDVCNRKGLVPIAMEFFEAMGAGATEGSKSKLDEADVYVGIFAHRYGYVENGYEKSVTEIEWDHAGQHGLERLCFMLEPELPWPINYVDRDSNYERLKAFRKRVNQSIRSQFTTVDNFSFKLMQALEEWLERYRRAVTFRPLTYIDRERERALFGDTVKFENDTRVLTVSAREGMGKTSLLEMFEKACRRNRGNPLKIVSRVSLDDSTVITTENFIDQVVKDLEGHGLSLPNYKRCVSHWRDRKLRGSLSSSPLSTSLRAPGTSLGTVDEADYEPETLWQRCVNVFLQELKSIGDKQPVILLVDSWNASGKDLLKRWIENDFLELYALNAETRPAYLVVVLAGDRLPDFQSVVGEDLVKPITPFDPWERDDVEAFLGAHGMLDVVEDDDIEYICRYIQSKWSLWEVLDFVKKFHQEASSAG
jgi:hypothetical protein